MTNPPEVRPPGRGVGGWAHLRELERLQWSPGDPGDPAALLTDFLQVHGLGGEPAAQSGRVGVALLLGAVGCELIAGLAPGRPSPVPAVPELVAVAVAAVEPSASPSSARQRGAFRTESFRTSWSDAEHARAVARVRASIADGDVYQANVVGHRRARYSGDPLSIVEAVAALPRAAYAGVLSGEGWAVGCASPEQLVRIDGERVTTEPIKGTSRDAAGLRHSSKDRAEHVMIVDLERNDLAQVCTTGSVEVERLYDIEPWADLFHASSRIAGRLLPGVTVMDVLRAVAPGGSVTGAPKRAALRILADLEPVGRGPAMGAFGLIRPGSLDLGLTIRTVGVDSDHVHLWAGGGITWGSDPEQEVHEAHAKAGPVLQALGQTRPSTS